MSKSKNVFSLGKPVDINLHLKAMDKVIVGTYWKVNGTLTIYIYIPFSRDIRIKEGEK
jgi:hypothetical protein